MWQSGLTNDQRDLLESLQRRAVKLISGSQDYEFYCCIYLIEPIIVRLDSLAQQFFHYICDSNNCINHILPNKRPIELANKLRQSNSLPGTLCSRPTNRFYKSFIPYAIQHDQLNLSCLGGRRYKLTLNEGGKTPWGGGGFSPSGRMWKGRGETQYSCGSHEWMTRST